MEHFKLKIFMVQIIQWVVWISSFHGWKLENWISSIHDIKRYRDGWKLGEKLSFYYNYGKKKKKLITQLHVLTSNWIYAEEMFWRNIYFLFFNKYLFCVTSTNNKIIIFCY